jgi:hypothetical protein
MISDLHFRPGFLTRIFDPVFPTRISGFPTRFSEPGFLTDPDLSPGFLTRFFRPGFLTRISHPDSRPGFLTRISDPDF